MALGLLVTGDARSKIVDRRFGCIQLFCRRRLLWGQSCGGGSCGGTIGLGGTGSGGSFGTDSVGTIGGGTVSSVASNSGAGAGWDARWQSDHGAWQIRTHGRRPGGRAVGVQSNKHPRAPSP